MFAGAGTNHNETKLVFMSYEKIGWRLDQSLDYS
jgi:hypothetical protein